MSLPTHYTSPDHYFRGVLTFFQEYKYLFQHPNTHIINKNIFEKIQITNMEEMDVFQENFNLRDVNNEYIKSFFDKLDRLVPVFEDFLEDEYLENVIVPLSPKKEHEIIYMAKEIRDVCELADCSVVVDFGSGLGYLDQRLHETTNYRILGIECNENNYVAAKKRQRKYHENSINNVKYVKHRVDTDSSCKNIESYLHDKFGQNDFCITGLHACADLTVDAINIFLKMAAAKCLIIMPCCYHKMVEIDGRFTNFPLSDCLRDIVKEYKAYDYLNVPFLRLGAQPPNWKDKMADLVFNLLARAILQLYAFRHNCKLKRNKRKAVRTKTLKNDFESYARDAIAGFTLTQIEPNDGDYKVEFDLEELNSIWRTMTEVTLKKAAVYILLQNFMQRVIENFILYDRIVYLKENGINRCLFKKIFDEEISPRCLALIAYK